MTLLYESDTPMKSTRKRKVRPGEYLVNASFPAKDLHQHTDEHGCCPPGKTIPDHCSRARTRDRHVQLDLAGPQGQVKSVCMSIPDFCDMTPELASDLRLQEVQFAMDCGSEYHGFIPRIHSHLAASLRDDLQKDEDCKNIPTRGDEPCCDLTPEEQSKFGQDLAERKRNEKHGRP